jgi:hypothetical protein
MLEKARQENFMHVKIAFAWQVANTPEEALDFIFNKLQPEENLRVYAAI